MSLLAFSLAIIAAIFHAAWNFLTKKVAGNINIIFLSLWIGSLAFLPFTAWFWSRSLFSMTAVLLILSTGVIHAVYFGALAYAYKFGEISTVYPVARGIGIAGTALIAFFLLEEQIPLLGGFGILLIGSGTIFISFANGVRAANFKALGFAVTVGLMISTYSIIDKFGVSYLHPVIYIFFLFFGAAFFLTPYMLLFHRKEIFPTWRQFPGHPFYIGIGSMVTYLFILFAYQLAKVSYVVAARESAVVFGALFGYRLLNESINSKKLLGLIAIIAGLLLLKMA